MRTGIISPWRPGLMIYDFEEVRKSLGIKQWIVIAHSFGAYWQPLMQQPARIQLKR